MAGKPKRWRDAPSPCIGVCRFREASKEGRRCIGCAMTKPEKKRFKRLAGKAERRPFLEMLAGRLTEMRRWRGWSRVYRRKCEKKGVPCPLDRMAEPGAPDGPAAAG